MTATADKFNKNNGICIYNTFFWSPISPENKTSCNLIKNIVAFYSVYIFYHRKLSTKETDSINIIILWSKCCFITC